jgi:ABC-type amino acid transport substrate-binding protein
MRLTAFLVFLFGTLSFQAFANSGALEGVKLRTTIWPPYQMMLQGELSGESTDTLRCIFGDINESFSVQVMPWQRAIQDIRLGSADGVFTSAPTPELEGVATMSAPFALEKWFWYHTDEIDLSDLDKLRIGAVRSSNQATWLESEGIKVDELVNEGLQLLRLVRAGRIDAFIADARHFDELMVLDGGQGAFSDYFARSFVRYMPLGVYFADEFLAAHPTFLKRFNEEIADCAGEAVTLSPQEIDGIRGVVKSRIEPELEHLNLLAALEEFNPAQENLSADVIQALDEQWRQEVMMKEQPLINEVLNRSASTYLRSVKQSTGRLISEFMLVGSAGLNVAQSDVTTDYYQADEQPWKNSFSSDKSEFHVGGIRYDESSRRFQVKVSWPVVDRAGKSTGIVVIGVDVEEALKVTH